MNSKTIKFPKIIDFQKSKKRTKFELKYANLK